jgi:hypothetical protein
MAASPLVVVDAANVVGSRPDGWWRDRPGAARRLLTRLAPLRDQGDLLVVLEGVARRAAEPGGQDGVLVVHAPGSGDDEIVRVVAEAAAADPERSIVVVTADRELRERVHELGAETVGPRWLLDRIDEHN